MAQPVPSPVPQAPSPAPLAPPPAPHAPAPDGALPAYAELHCRSNFSFLTGASQPAELVERAAQLGYTALAITDECSVAGVARAHEAAKAAKLHLVLGSEFNLAGSGTVPDCRVVALARNREGWGNLCELITLGRGRSAKGQYELRTSDLDQPDDDHQHLRGLPDCQVLLVPRREDPPEQLEQQVRWMAATFGERARIAIELLLRADDPLLAARLEALSAAAGIPLVAAGDVLMHRRSRKAVQDTLTAIRLKQPIAECGFALAPNAEQHLRPRVQLARLYRREWLEESVRIAALCEFNLDALRDEYKYPVEIVPEGHTATSYLRQETVNGACERYHVDRFDQVPQTVRDQIEKELVLIADLDYEAFFLTVYDIVKFARSQDIYCQGRGSAANSAVCYCLRITEVDPTQTTLLFERFISRERNEPPDIDVDFEHEKREQVIQYIYGKYGTRRTALAAALNTYRRRGAIRDVGKALGVDAHTIDTLAKAFQWFDSSDEAGQRLREVGIDPQSEVTRRWMELAGALRGFPRHLSQHVGGFVIARDKLSRLVPIENAAMDKRRVIQWDKEDLESLGLLKVDVLALGMLTALHRAMNMMNAWRRKHWTLQDIPREDIPGTYKMIQQADTIGVFQIESRAQQSMLPRLKPEKFYELVIEVAIVRPGPIQGGMVHPYLRRKQGKESARTPYPALDAALERTLGVPIFQEQVMQICMLAAGFTGGEADRLRRAMAAWRRTGDVGSFHDRIVQGMTDNGYAEEFAEAIFKQIQGFGDYGFPESHAFSFALLAYLSAWIKCHEPAIFLAALLNSQPMGFYGPSQLVQDARRHGVQVRGVDVTVSHWDCTLEPETPGMPADPAANPVVRLGLRMVQGFSEALSERLLEARAQAPFRSIEDLSRRARLEAQELQSLARADALQALSGHRRQQAWQATGQHLPPALLSATSWHEAALALPAPPEGEEILQDYASTGLSLRRHPVALLRGRLARRGWRSAAQLNQLQDGDLTWACGIVTVRQQPQTANNTIFVTIEDETGPVNVIVWAHVRKAYREALLCSRLLAVRGTWQNKEGVQHLVARRLVDASPWLGGLATVSRDFH
jgi:error-prone DNA polymerase